MQKVQRIKVESKSAIDSSRLGKHSTKSRLQQVTLEICQLFLCKEKNDILKGQGRLIAYIPENAFQCSKGQQSFWVCFNINSGGN